MSKLEVREMFQMLFFEDLDLKTELNNKIFEEAFADLDRQKTGWVRQNDLSDFFIRIAEREGSIKKLDDQNAEFEYE